jgi:peptidoglycan/LPS O-acetylase OafA/YrhL
VGIFILNFYIIHSDILRGFSAFLVGGSTYFLARLITDRLPELANPSIAACMVSWAIVITITYAPYQIYSSTPSIIQESFPVYFLFPLTILSITIIEVRGKLNAKKAAWLGTISYSSYLLHFPLQIIFALFAAAGLIPRGFQTSTIYLILFYAILILLSRFTYNWLEMPSQRLIRDHLLPTSSQKA